MIFNNSHSVMDYSTNYSFTFPNISEDTLKKMHLEQLDFVINMYSSENREISDPAYSVIITMYSILIAVAGIRYFLVASYKRVRNPILLVPGNLIVMITALWKKEMRTARNIFIFNLALSDLLLALSIPFTVIDALTRAWILPNSLASCRLFL